MLCKNCNVDIYLTLPGNILSYEIGHARAPTLLRGKKNIKKAKKTKLGNQRKKEDFVYKLYSCKSTGEQVLGRSHPARAPSSSGVHSREEEIPHHQKELSCCCCPCQAPLAQRSLSSGWGWEKLPHLCRVRAQSPLCPGSGTGAAVTSRLCPSPSAQRGLLT